MTSRTIITGAVLVLAVAAAGCGGGRDAAPQRDGGDVGTSGADLSGRIVADGSSTVGPFTTAAAERFQRQHPGVQITVGVSGTGGGFSRFCRGETDLSNASRPIDDEEAQQCVANGVDFVEFQIVNDGLSVVVNNENDWATCLTTDELKRIWEPGSTIRNWSQVRDGFPDVPLVLAGPGTDSGTFDYFTDEIVGESGASRSDFTASEDDNVVVQAVAGNRGGLGYFGLSYLEENEGRLRGVAIDGGEGCVEPSVETVQDGSYSPLGRPLFIYAKTAAFERPEVQAFVRTMIESNEEIATSALYVPLTDEQRERAEAALAEAAAEAGP
ncbi:MAG TPA: PstS family phosphate ABC transporter substrate-binding protein [Gaiellaceae bacterium]|jgi:phosphate transport system substrate-binding protein|nr:PstS family phosphate ABC transporter substrate-binding protein [Gaiellaceae bacterium]